MTYYYKIIISKIRNIFSTELIRVSSLNAISTLIRMLSGMVSMKIVAVAIETTGVALLGQLTNFITILQSIANGGINTGVTKYLAEYSSSRKRYLLFLGTSFWITVFFSVACSIVLIGWAGYFSRLILLDEKYRFVFYILGGTIILYALNALLLSAINGFKDYKRYVMANVLGSVVGLIFSVTLSLWFGLPGALVAAVTFQSVVFFLTLGMVFRTSWFNWKLIISRFRKGTARKLGSFSLMALASAITIPAGQLIVRGFIVDYDSLADAGLWSGLNRISEMYLSIVTLSLSVYYLPKLVELKTNRELQTEIHSVYKLILPFVLFTTAVIYLSRTLIIRILFTKEFLGMQDLFAFQLLGDFLKIAGWVLGYLLIAKAYTKTYITMELVNFVVLITVSHFLVKEFGAQGATMGYAIVYLVYLVTLSIFFRKILFGRHSLPATDNHQQP